MPPILTPFERYQRHKSYWSNCQDCELCSRRKRVVLLRGQVPAKVLFVGEAPGQGEDVLGEPFVGPAGHLLDRIIVEAGLGHRDAKGKVVGDFAMTNLIACIPRDESWNKITSPPKYAVEACAERLREITKIVNPKLLVWVGKDAETWGPTTILSDFVVKSNPYTLAILHPAAILRLMENQKPLAIRRCVINLEEAWSLVNAPNN